MFVDRPTVVLYDRGCLDGRAFCSPQQWNNVLKRVNRRRNRQHKSNNSANNENEKDGQSVSVLTNATLLKRYDLILHLTTTADGAEQHYEFG